MEFEEPEKLQVRISGVNLKEFINPNFLKLLDESFEDTKAVSLAIIIDNDTKDMITLGHPFMELIEQNKIVIDANEPESLAKIIEIMKKL
jgi:hypothetical protein